MLVVYMFMKDTLNILMKTENIKNLLINEIQKGNIKETGYDCPSGLEYVEIRNALFEVDKPYIFDKLKSYDRVTSDWYKINYDPLLYKNDQFNKFIHKLGNNPLTRQAVLFMGSVDEYDNENEMICTMYMHVFLNKIENDNYSYSNWMYNRSPNRNECSCNSIYLFNIFSDCSSCSIRLCIWRNNLSIKEKF